MRHLRRILRRHWKQARNIIARRGGCRKRRGGRTTVVAMVNGCHGPSTPQPARHTAARKKMPAGSGRDDSAKQGLKRSAGGDLADFGVFDGAPTEFFNGGWHH